MEDIARTPGHVYDVMTMIDTSVLYTSEVR